jgi:hypothetical protein
MSYLAVGILFLLIAAGFVTYLVLAATRKSNPASAGDTGAPGIGTDHTPLGDTADHAGRQTSDGETVAGQDAAASGGTGRPVEGTASTSASQDQDPPRGRFKRDPIGGEAEGRPAVPADTPRP